jgi:hypothetical protein
VRVLEPSTVGHLPWSEGGFAAPTPRKWRRGLVTGLVLGLTLGLRLCDPAKARMSRDDFARSLASPGVAGFQIGDASMADQGANMGFDIDVRLDLDDGVPAGQLGGEPCLARHRSTPGQQVADGGGDGRRLSLGQEVPAGYDERIQVGGPAAPHLPGIEW